MHGKAEIRWIYAGQRQIVFCQLELDACPISAFGVCEW